MPTPPSLLLRLGLVLVHWCASLLPCLGGLLLATGVHDDEGVLQQLPHIRADPWVPRQGCGQEADCIC
jgi:hypothetical protein